MSKNDMNPREFHLNANDYGLPTRDELVAMRIWDSHYHGFSPMGGDPIKQHRDTMFYVERMGIERVVPLDIGRGSPSPLDDSPSDAQVLDLLNRNTDRIAGIVRIDQSFPEKSCEKMEKWIRNGPCIGIKYLDGGVSGFPITHPNNDPIVKLAADLNAVIYVHTWLKVGGTPRLPGGADLPGEATPMDLAALAARYPKVTFICGHSGGDWELGVRAVRSSKNILLEFAGSDPHSGEVDFAVKELGADRIVWGGHGPSRSFATELGKVLDANLTKQDRMKILGGNYRRLAAPIFRKKGWKIEI